MAQSLGFIYALFLFFSILGKSTKQILLMQTISFLFKSVHYYLLGGISGFVTSFISMLRNLIFYRIKENYIFTIIFILIYIVIGIVTYNSFYSFLPAIATIVYTLIINYDNPKYLRLGMLFTSITWLIYNVYIISYSGIIIQIIMIVTNIFAILKLDKKK